MPLYRISLRPGGRSSASVLLQGIGRLQWVAHAEPLDGVVPADPPGRKAARAAAGQQLHDQLAEDLQRKLVKGMRRVVQGEWAPGGEISADQWPGFHALAQLLVPTPSKQLDIPDQLARDLATGPFLVEGPGAAADDTDTADRGETQEAS